MMVRYPATGALISEPPPAAAWESPVGPGTDRTPDVIGGGSSVVVVDNRKDTRDFLASRRARITLTPEHAGLPGYGRNRRVPGQRREEVALLAGVSVDYYTRLERGNLNGVSDTVLKRSPGRCSSTKPSERTCSTSPARRTARPAPVAVRHRSGSGPECSGSSTPSPVHRPGYATAACSSPPTGSATRSTHP
jgi:hypothetical protein